MGSNREKEFGILISTILPGFMTIVGFADHSPLVEHWLGQSSSDAPSVGGFLFLTVAAVFVGLTVGAIRWAVVDRLHHNTGINPPNWRLKNLDQKEQAFSLMIEIHYRYYQFYANSLVAIPLFLVGRLTSTGFIVFEWSMGLFLGVLFYAGSRDALDKYYKRVSMLLSS